MSKIDVLIAEDEDGTREILEYLIKDFLQNVNLDKKIVIDTAVNGLEALGLINLKKYDLIFLDVLMPKCDGFRVLNNIRIAKQDKVKPYICMSTSLNEAKHKFLFQLKGANSYIIKPIEKEKLDLILKAFLEYKFPSINQEETIDEFDDFYDFDEMDEFSDFDEISEENQQKINDFNLTHKKIHASDYLQEYNNIDYIVEEINEIDDDIEEMVDMLDVINFEENIDQVIFILEKYASFLNSLSEFYELSSALTMLKNMLKSIEISNLNDKDKNFILLYLKALIEDLYDWKEHVFILQDAVDIFYINASSLANCMQLENFLEKIRQK